MENRFQITQKSNFDSNISMEILGLYNYESDAVERQLLMDELALIHKNSNRMFI